MNSTRFIWLLSVWLFLGGASAARAADAGAIADREALQADLRRLNATTDSLVETQAALQRRLEALSERCLNLEQKLSQNKDSVSRAEVKRLVDRLAEEFDQKRKEDKRVVLEAIDELKRLVKSPASSGSSRETSGRSKSGGSKKSAEGEETPAFTGKFHEYKIQQDQYLGEVIAEYNKAYKERNLGSITLKDVLRANPGLDPRRMRVGQIVRIPEPSK